MVGYGVGYFFRPFAGVCEVIFAIVFVNPRSLSERMALVNMDAFHLSLCFYHVVFQFHDITFAVTPREVSLSVVIDEYGRIDTSPTVVGIETVFVGEQRLA